MRRRTIPNSKPGGESGIGGALDEATSLLLAVAPKVAVVAGLAALIMLCIPFTQHHAHGMLLAGFVGAEPGRR